MKNLPSALFVLLCATPAFASVTISSPSNGSDVKSPFTLDASASPCSSQPISAMAYSLDGGADLATVSDTSLKEEVSANSGSHTVHVKSWGDNGAVCVSDVTVNVTGTGSPGTTPPSGSTSISSLQTLGGWRALHDAGTPGSSSGSTSVASSPSRSGASRRFVTHFSGSGGERYYLTFGDDASAENFLYDTWVYIAGSANDIGNIEMDMNQVMPNGQTVIYGFQCDGYAGTWDYTVNTGSASHPHDAWVHSGVGCNPASWSPNAWHHIQVSYSRTSSGYVTYKSVTFDGAEHSINATRFSAFALGWGQVLMTNFQIDGRGSGSNTVYMDDLTITRW